MACLQKKPNAEILRDVNPETIGWERDKKKKKKKSKKIQIIVWTQTAFAERPEGLCANDTPLERI